MCEACPPLTRPVDGFTKPQSSFGKGSHTRAPKSYQPTYNDYISREGIEGRCQQYDQEALFAEARKLGYSPFGLQWLQRHIAPGELVRAFEVADYRKLRDSKPGVSESKG